MSPPLRALGRVTLATVRPAVNMIGAVAKTYVVTWSGPPEPLRYGIRTATRLPYWRPSPPAPRVQSPNPIVAAWVLPSVYVMVSVPVTLPLVPVPRTDSRVADAGVPDRSRV